MANHFKIWLAIWLSWVSKNNKVIHFKNENYEKLGTRVSHCSGKLNISLALC